MTMETGVVNIALIDVKTLVRNWWVVLLRGLAAVLFGLLTLFAPEISLTALVLLFGAYALVDGVLALVSAVRRRGQAEHWWMLLLEGVAGIGVGVVTFVWPGISALALLYLIAAWALVTGTLEIIAAVRLRKAITGEWLLALSGIASVAFAVLLVIFPGPGALAVVLLIGAYALVAGGVLIALAFRLRSWAKVSNISAPEPRGRSRLSPTAA
jgi:uncharacterized membrane protein HdeD (DUF308 family)